MVKERFSRSSSHVNIGSIGRPKWSKLIMCSSIGTYIFSSGLQVGKTALALEMEKDYKEFIEETSKKNNSIVPVSVYQLIAKFSLH